MTQVPIRVYADTSVFGGAFDHGFDRDSLRFFELVRSGRFNLVTSALVGQEISNAPGHVRSLFDEMTRGGQLYRATSASAALRDEYLRQGVVSEKYSDDAFHVAIASTAGCRLLVSWNYRHIVHFQKIPLFNAVNVLQGYPEIWIAAPPEVL